MPQKTNFARMWILGLVARVLEGRDKRREPRASWNSEAIIMRDIRPQLDRPALFHGTIIDRSPYGLRIAHAESLPIGETIRVLTDSGFVFHGRVVWSRAAEDRFESGLSALPATD